MDRMNKALTIIIIVLLVVNITLEVLGCGSKYVECDEGTFTCVKRFLGGEPIYKETKTTWWLWPKETKGSMIVCHNCKFKESE